MTIKLTFEYRTVEEATIALGKLGGLMAVRDSSLPPISTALPVLPAEKVKRKYNTRKSEALPPPEPVVVKDEPAHSNSQEVVAPVATPTVGTSLDDVQNALQNLFAGKGIDKAIALLNKYGVKRARDLKPEVYNQFISDVSVELSGPITIEAEKT